MKRKWTILFVVSIMVAGFFSLLASSKPDGLEKVASDQGFIIKALAYPWAVLMPDYVFSAAAGNGLFGQILAGIIGVLFTIATIIGLIQVFKKFFISNP